MAQGQVVSQPISTRIHYHNTQAGQNHKFSLYQTQCSTSLRSQTQIGITQDRRFISMPLLIFLCTEIILILKTAYIKYRMLILFLWTALSSLLTTVETSERCSITHSDPFYEGLYNIQRNSLIRECPFDIFGLCINPAFPCSKTYLDKLYDESHGSTGKVIWSETVVPFWLIIPNSFSSSADFPNIDNTLRRVYTQAYYLFQAVQPEMQTLQLAERDQTQATFAEIVYTFVNNQSAQDALWRDVLNMYRTVTGRNWTTEGLKELVTLRLQSQIPCHQCSEYYGFATSNQINECSACPANCRSCNSNNQQCTSCVDGYILNISNLCVASSSGSCSANSQRKAFYQCRYENERESFICSCDFQVFGICVYPAYPCKNSKLSQLYDENHYQTGRNMWYGTVVPFWLSIPNSFSNSASFLNIDNTLRRVYTQAYYLFQAVQPEMQTLQLAERDQTQATFAEIVYAFANNQSAGDALWRDVLNMYRTVTGRNWTTEGLKELVTLRLQSQIPCHQCSEYYGTVQFNNAALCFSCPENCRLCSENISNCQACLQGFHLDPKTKKCQAACPRRKEFDHCLDCSYLFLNHYECKKCSENFGLSYSTALNTYICSQCPVRCKSCSENSTVCTSCIEGFYFSPELAKCMKSRTIQFTYRIGIPYRQFVDQNRSSAFVDSLAGALRIDRYDIIIQKIYQGSTVIQGIISTTQQEAPQVFNNLKTLTLQGFQILSSNFYYEGQKFSCYNGLFCVSQSNNHLLFPGMIIIIIFCSVGVILLFVCSFVCYRKYLKEKQQNMLKDKRNQSTFTLPNHQQEVFAH